MRPLTDNARRNLASGATSGPGTMTCRKCSGPKDENRINSSRCLSCDNGDRVQMTKVSLPTTLVDRLLALAPGKPLDDCIYLLLDQAVPASPVVSTPGVRTDPVRPHEWAALLAWIKDDVSRIREYTGPTTDLTDKTRLDLYLWCIDHGFTPPTPEDGD